MIAALWKPVQRESGRHYTWGGDNDGWHLLQRHDLSVIAEHVPPGGREQRHHHGHARQFFYLLGGRAVIELAGREVALAAGQGLEVPPGLPQGLSRREVTLAELRAGDADTRAATAQTVSRLFLRDDPVKPPRNS